MLLHERLEDRSIKLRTLAFRVQITGNATPASKVHRPDLGTELVVLRTEGKTADADAVEDLSAAFTTAVDATNAVFGMILRKELTDEQMDGFGDIERVVDVAVTDIAGTATSVTATLLTGTGVVRGLTTDKNIAIQISAPGLDLETENADLQLVVRYLVK